MKRDAAAIQPTEKCHRVPVLLSTRQFKTLQQSAKAGGTTPEHFILQALIEKQESAALPACPFCRQADRLVFIDWCNERRDGTEYNGEAVRCERCGAIAPISAWMAVHHTGRPA